MRLARDVFDFFHLAQTSLRRVRQAFASRAQMQLAFGIGAQPNGFICWSVGGLRAGVEFLFDLEFVQQGLGLHGGVLVVAGVEVVADDCGTLSTVCEAAVLDHVVAEVDEVLEACEDGTVVGRQGVDEVLDVLERDTQEALGETQQAGIVEVVRPGAVGLIAEDDVVEKLS